MGKNRGVGAPRIPKLKHGGLCRDCPYNASLFISSTKREVCCTANPPKEAVGWRKNIPLRMCADRPASLNSS